MNEEELAYWSTEFPSLDSDDIRYILEGLDLDMADEDASGFSDFLMSGVAEEVDPITEIRDRAISKLNSKKTSSSNVRLSLGRLESRHLEIRQKPE